MSEKISYAALNQCLESLHADANAAEIHGQLCGLLCAEGDISDAQWVKQAISPISSGDESARTLKKSQVLELLNIKKSVSTQLNSNELTFDLLLPDMVDDSPEALAEQIDALATWCQGFLFGLSQGGVEDVDQLPQDATEVMVDLVEISQMSHEGVEDEQAYVQFVEIMEYVRVGVLLMNEALHPMRHSKIDTQGYEEVDIFGDDTQAEQAATSEPEHTQCDGSHSHSIH